MRNATIPFMLALLAATTPVQAQEVSRDQESLYASRIADSAKRAALHLELQPTTQRAGSGGKVLWWTGWAMMAGGGVMAALSKSVLADTSGLICYEDKYLGDPCLNQKILWTGLALAGAGATMAIIGKRQQRQAVITFVPTRGGAAVFQSITF